MSLENLPAGANISIGAGSILALVLGAILRGLLIPSVAYNRLLSDLDKKDAEIARLVALQNAQAAQHTKLTDSFERLSRRNNRGRE